MKLPVCFKQRVKLYIMITFFKPKMKQAPILLFRYYHKFIQAELLKSLLVGSFHVKLRNYIFTEKFPSYLKGMTIYSNIIPSDGFLHSHLSRFLEPAVGSHPYWKLYYRASHHGWSSSTFHSLCDGRQHTVTLIRKKQYVFGGYTYTAWGKKHYR